MTRTPGIALERHGRVATVAFRRPPLNVLDLETLQALRETLLALRADPELTLVFLRGDGGRAFSAGTAVQDHVADRVAPMLQAIHGAVRELRALPAISVAAVEGVCLGGGMEIALSCDLVLATEDSRFGQPEVDLGCFPPVAAALYPSRWGAGRVLDLLATGRPFSALQAERYGMVQRLLPAGGLAAGCAALEEEFAAKSAPVLRLIKEAVRAGSHLPPDAALAECERIYLEQLAPLADMQEGVAAFLEKRPPSWRHR